MERTYNCKFCGLSCGNPTTLGRHYREEHGDVYVPGSRRNRKRRGKGVKCRFCGKILTDRRALGHHYWEEHPEEYAPIARKRSRRSAFSNQKLKEVQAKSKKSSSVKGKRSRSAPTKPSGPELQTYQLLVCPCCGAPIREVLSALEAYNRALKGGR
jgi:hypothetical protein